MTMMISVLLDWVNVWTLSAGPSANRRQSTAEGCLGRQRGMCAGDSQVLRLPRETTRELCRLLSSVEVASGDNEGVVQVTLRC